MGVGGYTLEGALLQSKADRDCKVKGRISVHGHCSGRNIASIE